MLSPDQLAKARAQAQRCMVPVPPPAPAPSRTREDRVLLIGVYPSKIPSRPWRVRIRVEGRMLTLGTYATVAEAAAVAAAGWPPRA